MKLVYSGKASAGFWRKLRRIKNPALHKAAYEMACTLQSVEYATLNLMKDGASKKKRV